jgi:CRISPR-associated protein Cas1
LDRNDDPDDAPASAGQPTGVKSAPSIRRLMPARDDALPLYINEQGARLGKNGERLQIQSQGKTLREVKLMDVSQVSLFGNVQVSSQALRELSSRGVPVCHFSYGGWFQAITTGMTHKNIDLRQRQFALAADAKASLNLARQFIAGKIKNCRTLLRRNLPEKKVPCLARLAEFHQDVLRAESAETLLGLEGMAAKVYFENFGRLLKAGEAFQVNGRNRRPPTDPVNCVLSFLYAMLCKDLTVTLQAVGFDPMLGFFHRPRYGRPSLALDLAEEFRPLIADSTALMLINNGEVKESSFLRRAGAVALTKAGRRAVIESYERRMDSLATHPIFGYRISYRRILEVQARLLARTVTGELEQYPNYCTR